MSKPRGHDLIIIGGGVAGALTALAAAGKPAGRRASRRSVCLVRSGPPEPPDTVSADYTFLNPRTGTLLPTLKPCLRQAANGSFKGLLVIGARDGRRAEFRSRSVCGHLLDSAKLLRGLLSLCRSAGVKVVRPPGRPKPATAGEPPPPKQPLRLRRPEGPSAEPRFFADDHGVHGVWPGGGCDGRVALLADLDVGPSGQAEGLGFRRVHRLFRCCGVTFAVSPRRLDEVFGRSRRLLTVWQLDSLNGGEGAAALAGQADTGGPDGHAWIMPRKNSVSVAVLAARPEAEQGHGEDPEALMGRVLGELRFLNVLPPDIEQRTGPVRSWPLPLAGALEVESHAAKRSLAVGLAGGFVAALSGQWLYPTVCAAVLAAAVANKALDDPRPQDVLSQFSVRWRQKLADYLRSPNTRLAFLLPLVFGNQQIADRFGRAYLFGENF